MRRSGCYALITAIITDYTCCEFAGLAFERNVGVAHQPSAPEVVAGIALATSFHLDYFLNGRCNVEHGTDKNVQPPFDLKVFLIKANGGRTGAEYRTNDSIFVQGEPADAIFYIKEGKVKLTVVSKRGKEAVVAILGDGDFCGEGCLAGQPVRMASAIAMSACSVMKLEKTAVLRLLHEEPSFTELFVAHLLSRNIKIEEDLVDQLFNSSEKRPARVLLLLANFGKEGVPLTVIPKINQETLAEIIGTTRSRVSFFMNRFRKLGFVDYNGGLKVHSSLLNIVLHD